MRVASGLRLVRRALAAPPARPAPAARPAARDAARDRTRDHRRPAAPSASRCCRARCARPSEQIAPDEAEADAAAHPPPPGAPVTGTPAPYSAHSMIYACCTPAAQKERAFAAARASGAGYVRLDVNLRGVFARAQGQAAPPRLERASTGSPSLGRRYKLPVVAVLTHVPDHITQCHDRQPAQLPGRRLRGLRALRRPDRRAPGGRGHPLRDRERARRALGLQGLAAGVRAHARGRAPPHHDARAEGAHPARRPDVPATRSWISAMLATPGVSTPSASSTSRTCTCADRASRLGSVGQALARVLRRSAASAGQLWVTEHGYPGSTRFQYDRAFRGGEDAQAAYLERVAPRACARRGARQVFVTLRDSWRSEFLGEYASEGVISLGQRSPFAVRRKAVLRRASTQLNARWRKARAAAERCAASPEGRRAPPARRAHGRRRAATGRLARRYARSASRRPRPRRGSRAGALRRLEAEVLERRRRWPRGRAACA